VESQRRPGDGKCRKETPRHVQPSLLCRPKQGHPIERWRRWEAGEEEGEGEDEGGRKREKERKRDRRRRRRRRRRMDGWMDGGFLNRREVGRG
jgi:hypothetical protein